MLSRFYQTLFEPGEHVCWGRTTYETAVRPLRWTETDEQFFVINPLKDSRRDDNVTAFRNILVEFDKLSIKEQHKLIERSGLPYSTLVYSGGKSLHVIISLETPLQSKEAYKALAKQIYKKLGGADVVDDKTSNPSRFSRAPDAIRDNGVRQDLLEVRARVPNQLLYDWLGPIELEKQSNFATFKSDSKLITIRALAFLRYGAEPGQWNTRLFGAACDLFRFGHSLEEVEQLCATVTGYLDNKDRSTIKSAYKTIHTS